MGKLKRFYVMFDSPSAVYRPGETVTGHLELELSEPMEMKCIRCKFVGQCWVAARSTYDQEMDRRKDLNRGGEDYFKQKLIFPETGGTPKQHKMAAGIHRYPFTIVLPSGIPCSFEKSIDWSSTTAVRYYAQFYIDPLKDWTTKATAFTVIRDLDLNTDAAQFFDPYESCFHRNITRGLILRYGTVSATVYLSKRCFVPGETIAVSANIANNSERVIRQTRVTLQQVVEYKGRFLPSPNPRLHSDVCTAAFDRVEPGSSRVWNNVPLLVVPSVPPSRLDCCETLTLIYRIEFQLVVDVPGAALFGNNVAPEYVEILIGTIPLHENRLRQQIPTAPRLELEACAFQRPESCPAPPSYEDCVVWPTYEDSVTGPVEIYGGVFWAPRYPVYRELSSVPQSGSHSGGQTGDRAVVREELMRPHSRPNFLRY